MLSVERAHADIVAVDVQLAAWARALAHERALISALFENLKRLLAAARGEKNADKTSPKTTAAEISRVEASLLAAAARHFHNLTAVITLKQVRQARECYFVLVVSPCVDVRAVERQRQGEIDILVAERDKRTADKMAAEIKLQRARAGYN